MPTRLFVCLQAPSTTNTGPKKASTEATHEGLSIPHRTPLTAVRELRSREEETASTTPSTLRDATISDTMDDEDCLFVSVLDYARRPALLS